MSVRTIRSIEAGRNTRPRPTTVRLLASALGLTGAEHSRFCEAALAEADQPPGPGWSGQPTPSQLPADLAAFTGRIGYLAELTELVDGDDAPATVVISAIAGTAGVGKTTLAVHWAHRVAERFPDGQLYVNLRGFSPAGSAMSPAEAVRGFLDAFAVPAEQIPTNLDAQVGLYRSVLAGKRVLVVLDNARDADQVRPLLPASPGCHAVVTSRIQLTGLVATEGARPLALDLLPEAEARQLLARRLGEDRVTAERDAVEEIITRCAGLPLALAIVAARAATQPRLTLGELAGQLRDSTDRLDALTSDDPAADVRAVISWSYRALGEDAARLFRLLGLHPGPDISAPAAASLAGVPTDRVQLLLNELTKAHLVNEPVPGRYTFHDLLRAYAGELAHHHESEPERRAAGHRLLDHYLHTGFAATMLLNQHRPPVPLDHALPGVSPEQLADLGQAMAWFTTERPVLVAAIHRAVDAGFDGHAWRLAWTLTTYLSRRGHWQDWATTQQAGLAAARRLADPYGQAHAHRDLALAYARLGRYDQADAHLPHALRLFDQLADHAGQAHVHRAFALVCAQQGRHRDALHHSQQALALFQTAADRAWEGYALNLVGWYHAQLGSCHEALDYCRRALKLLREYGDRSGEASTWDSLGYAHHHLGDHRQAVACYRRAAELRRKIGERYTQSITLTRLGQTYRAAGDPDSARRSWRDALAILTDLGHPDAAVVRASIRALDET